MVVGPAAERLAAALGIDPYADSVLSDLDVRRLLVATDSLMVGWSEEVAQDMGLPPAPRPDWAADRLADALSRRPKWVACRALADAVRALPSDACVAYLGD